MVRRAGTGLAFAEQAWLRLPVPTGGSFLPAGLIFGAAVVARSWCARWPVLAPKARRVTAMLALCSTRPARYHRPINVMTSKERDMTQRISVSFSMGGWSLVSNSLPPRDPNDDDDDDEDEDSNTEPDNEREPAVIREPDKDE
jgi:hypothetical protein